MTKRCIELIATVAALAVAAGTAAVAPAQTTYYVDASCGDDSWTGLSDVCQDPDGPKATIEAAFALAISGDTILVADGTYNVPADTGLVFGGRDILVESINGPAQCTIDLLDAGRAFTFDAGETGAAEVNGFTIRNGRSDAQGGAILCDGASPRISNCTISNCQADDGGGIAVINGGHPTLRNLDFRSVVAIERGAGIFVFEGSADIDTCTVLDGSATFGGAIYALSFTSVTIDAAHFETCLANSTGGAVYLRDGGTVSVTGATLNNNLAPSASGLASSNCDLTLTSSQFLGHRGTPVAVVGGSLVADNITCENNRSNGMTVFGADHVDIANSVFKRNRTAGLHLDTSDDINLSTCTFDENAPGLRITSSDALMSNCNFFDNERGALLEGGNGGFFLTTFHACVFSRNHANEGGALKVASSNILRLVNCLIANNTADNEGGAVMVRELAGLLVINSTIANNSAGVAAGGIGKRSGGDSLITNSILYANLAPFGRNIALDGSQDVGTMQIKYSNIRGGEAGIPVGASANLIWGDGNVDIDPKFVNSSRGDYRLRANSRCIDAGNNSSVPADLAESDLLGNPRFLDNPDHPDTGSGVGPIVDIGAAEHQGV